MSSLARTGWTIAGMTKVVAQQIVGWRYEPPYDFYNLTQTTSVLSELLDGTYYMVGADDDLRGFFCTGLSARVPGGDYRSPKTMVDIGLGLRPDLTGKGLGRDFVLDVIEQVSIPPIAGVRLTVAAFNQRALHLYDALGFTRRSRFWLKSTEFHIMERTAAD